MTDSDLKRIERSTFRAAVDSGLWDVLLASVVAMFAIAPVLSVRMGDFWSSAVFVPVYGIVIVAIRFIQARVVRPRLGVVDLARPRRKRLALFGVIMLVANLTAFVLGIIAAMRSPVPSGQVVSLGFSLTLLVGFSTAAFFLEIPRVFFYGLLLAIAPPIGEALFVRGHASHHGFPIVFGVSAVMILICGIVRFVRFLPKPDISSHRAITEDTNE